jgi:hypothetical protein
MKFQISFLLILILMLTVACQPGSSSTQVPDEILPTTEMLDEQGIPSPDSSSQPFSTEKASDQTATSQLPTPTDVPPSGLASFRDSLATADQFEVTMTNVSKPPEAQVYQGWLLGEDFAVLNLGVLDLSADGSAFLQWNSPTSENLLNLYSQFQITLEPAPGSETPTGQVVFSGSLDENVHTIAKWLFLKNEGQLETPRNTAFSLGLVEQMGVARQHIQNAVNAAAIGAMPEMRLHLEHVINIMNGIAGERYGDYTGDGRAENPGDGFGVIGYVGAILEHLETSKITNETTAVGEQIVFIQDRAIAIISMEEMGEAISELDVLLSLVDELQTGAVSRLYQATQDAISFTVTPIE